MAIELTILIYIACVVLAVVGIQLIVALFRVLGILKTVKRTTDVVDMVYDKVEAINKVPVDKIAKTITTLMNKKK